MDTRPATRIQPEIYFPANLASAKYYIFCQIVYYYYYHYHYHYHYYHHYYYYYYYHYHYYY